MISTSVASYIVVFKDGSKKFLNEKAYRFIWDESLKEKPIIHIGGQLINLSSIKVLCSLEDYYVQYPNDRPVQNYKDFTGQGVLGVLEKHKDNKVGLKGMIKGMKHFLSDKKPGECKNAEGLLELMELKLNA